MQFKSGLDKAAIFVLFMIIVVVSVMSFIEHALDSLHLSVRVDIVTYYFGKLLDAISRHFSDPYTCCYDTLAICMLMLSTYVFRRSKVVYVRVNGESTSYSPEKMMPGSSFEANAVMPKFQCSVYGSEDGSIYYPLGQAFRVAQGIMTAAHVVIDCRYVRFVKDKAVVQVNFDRMQYMDGDMALYKATAQESSTLGLLEAKFAKDAVVEHMGPMVQVVAFGNRSFGFLNPYKQFGYCKYAGSTIKGFSGAPYYVNKTVYGMHLGGDAVNLGYEGAYIQSLLRPSKTIIRNQEASEDWLIDQAYSIRKFEYDRSPYDPDEYRVRIGNRYHIVETDVLDRMLAVSQGTAKQRPTYDRECDDMPPVPAVRKLPPQSSNYDLELTPADELPLAPRGALDFDQGNLRRGPNVDVGARGRGEVRRSVVSQPERISPPTSSEYQQPSEIYHTESLSSTPVQPNEVSASTRKRQRAGQKYRKLRSEFEQLKIAYELMQRGQQT